MFRAAGLLLAAFTVSLAPARAGSGASRGAPRPVTFEYRRLAGAERCPDRAAIEAQVTEILGHSPFAKHATRAVRCTLRGGPDAIAARVELVDARSRRVLGVRELSSPGCEELGAALALAIALAIDPLARPPSRPSVAVSTPAPPVAAANPPSAVSMSAGAGLLSDRWPGKEARPALPDAGPPTLDAGPPAPDAGVAPAVLDAGPSPSSADAGVAVPDAGVLPEPDVGVPPPAAAEAVADVQPPAAGWRPIAGVGAVVAVGALPGVAGGLLVHAGAASSKASVEVEARWLPGTQLAFGAGSISASLVTGALVGCARFGPWAACGLTQAGPLKAQGQGYGRSEDASAWLVSVGARGQWEWIFAGPVGVRLHLDGMVNLVRPRLLVDAQVAWSTPPVAMWVGGGLFGRF